MSLTDRLPPTPDPDALVEVFADWAFEEQGISLYPAQEEALLELVTGANVILSTPTGSGKSLIALGAHVTAMSRGERSVYTAPIKALVSEKFFSLGAQLGYANVGMLTGDAAVNPEAPVICCTAEVLAKHRLGATVQAIVADFHTEATSEKMAYAHSFDGTVSLVVGTHTHCPSADHHILAGGTAFQSDAGMCGDYDSVIGMSKAGAAARFWRKMPGERLSPADGEATVCGLFVETDDATGLALRVEPVRQGGRLSQAMPAA